MYDEPEVLHLELTDRRALAVAVVRVGVVEINRVRVVEVDGRLQVKLPPVQVPGGGICPAVRLPRDLHGEVCRAVLAEYRRVMAADPWADVRRLSAGAANVG